MKVQLDFRVCKWKLIQVFNSFIIAYIVQLLETVCCKTDIQNNWSGSILVSQTIYLTKFFLILSWMTCLCLSLYLRFDLKLPFSCIYIFLGACLDIYFVHFLVIFIARQPLLFLSFYSSFFNVIPSFKYLFSRRYVDRMTDTPERLTSPLRRLSAASPSPLQWGSENQRRGQSGVKAGRTVLRLSGKKVLSKERTNMNNLD